MKRKPFFILLIVFIMVFLFPVQAMAAGDIVAPDEFDNLTDGDGKYLTDEYRDNYFLDIKDLGITEGFEKAANGIANALFGLIYFLGYATVVIFYYCFSLDLASMFGTAINSLLSGIKGVFFDSFFVLAFVTCAFFICKQLLSRNVQAIINEILKVVLLVVISIAVTTQGSTFLTFVNGITKETAAKALGEFSGESASNINNYAASASGALWGSLVHKPWVSLEFGLGYSVDEQDIQKILETPKGSEEREKVVKKFNESKGLFEKDVGTTRIGFSLALLIPIIAKCGLFIVISFVQIAFQVLTLFYVLICPIILVLAVSPSLGGIDLVWKWLGKLFENMVTVFLLTLIIGIIVKFDALIFNNSARWGWVIGLIVQIFIAAALIIYRDKILSVIVDTSRYVRRPQAFLNQNTAQRYYRNVESMGHTVGAAAARAGHWSAAKVTGAAQAIGGSAMDAARDTSGQIMTAASWAGEKVQYAAEKYAERAAAPPHARPESTPSTAPQPPETQGSTRPSNVIDVDFRNVPQYKSRHTETEEMERPVSSGRPREATAAEAPARPRTVMPVSRDPLEYESPRRAAAGTERAKSPAKTDRSADAPPVSAKAPVYTSDAKKGAYAPIRPRTAQVDMPREQAPITPMDSVPVYTSGENKAAEQRGVPSPAAVPAEAMHRPNAPGGLDVSPSPAPESFRLPAQAKKDISPLTRPTRERNTPDQTRSRSSASDGATPSKQSYTTLPNSDAPAYTRTNSRTQAPRRPQKASPLSKERISKERNAKGIDQRPAQAAKKAIQEPAYTKQKKAQ